MKKPNITIAEDEWNCPYIRVEEDDIVLDMEEVRDSYKEMIDTLILCKKVLASYSSEKSVTAWYKAEQALKKAGCKL